MDFKKWVASKLDALGTTGGRLCSYYGFSDSAFSKGVERAADGGHAKAVLFMLAAEEAGQEERTFGIADLDPEGTWGILKRTVAPENIRARAARWPVSPTRENVASWIAFWGYAAPGEAGIIVDSMSDEFMSTLADAAQTGGFEYVRYLIAVQIGASVVW
jgi:hypothetical protein